MGAGPNAEEVGKVAIKVVPNTSKFGREARNELRGETEKIPKVEVRLTPVATGFKQDLARMVRELSAEIRDDSRFKVKLRAEIDPTGMVREVRKVVREATAIAKSEKVKLRVDLAAVAIEGELDQDSLKVVERELKRWRDRVSPLKVAIKPDLVQGTLTAVQGRLKILTRPREIKLLPVLDKSAVGRVTATLAALSGARVLNSVLDGLWARLSRLDKAVPIIGTMAEAIAGLGAGGLAASSNLFALSQSLAQIGPAVLTLPGILGGMAVATGVMVAALKDFNTVLPEMSGKLSTLQNQISDNFWAKAEAPIRNLIDNLFPEFSAGAQRTATALGTYFGNFATSITGKLTPALDGMFADLNQSITIFGQHTNSVVGIITTLGTVGAGYLPRLAGYIGDLSDKFDAFLTRTSKSGELTGWIDQAIFQIQELGRALGNIGGIFAGLAQAANAAGGSTLTAFADALQRAETAVKSAGFQVNLVNVLRAAHDAMSRIANGIGPSFSKFLTSLAQLATTVFPLMGDTVGKALNAVFTALSRPAVSDGLIQMFAGLAQAVDLLAPAMGPIADAFGALGGIIGALAPVLAGVLAPALSALAVLFVAIAPGIEQVIGLLGGAFAGVITSIAGPVAGLGDTLAKAFVVIMPALAPVVEFIANLASAVLPILIDGIGRVIVALTPLIVAFGQLVSIVGPVLLPILTFLAGVLVDTIVMAVQGVVGVITGLINIFMGLWNFLDDLFHGRWGELWGDVLQVFSGIWQLIVGAFKVFITVGLGGIAKLGMSALRGLFTSSLGAIRGVFSSAWNAIVVILRVAWVTIKALFTTGVNAMKSLIGGGVKAVLSLFGPLGNGLKTLASSAWNLVKSAFSSGISTAVGLVKGLGGKVKSAVGNLGSILADAGRSVIQGFVNGISSMFGAVKGKLGELTSKLTSWKGPPKTDAVILKDAGVLVIQGFIEGLESQYDAVKESLGGLTSDLAGTSMSVPAPQVNTAGRVAASRAIDAMNPGSNAGSSKTLNYYAAPGSSLDSEEDLFKAASRARMGW